MLKVYVAGGSDDLLFVRDWIAKLRSKGIEITHDWTTCPGYGRESTVAERLTWARQDAEGVRKADIVWLIAPDKKNEGSATELGIALGLGKTIFTSGPLSLRIDRIFHLMARNFPGHWEAYEEICRSALPGASG